MAQRTNSNNLKLFNRDTFPLFSFFVLFLFCLIMMVADYRYQILKNIKSEFTITTSPITYLINLPVNLFNESKDSFITKALLKEKIKNLEEIVYNLSIQAQENKLIKAENKLLRNILKIQKDFGIIGKNAEIILPEVRNGYSIITINKGLGNNIKNGAPVINHKGLVGQIINISENYSEIKPITSKTYAVPAIMNNGKENVILYGNGNGELEIPLFPASSSIQINDTFITSGIDDIYPKGINIGRVTEIKPTKSPKFNCITVKPFSQPTTFSQITVLKIKND
jgi:rod shape-determining protein MreC